jgi:phage host-nuclease inhibitor protein Gam
MLRPNENLKAVAAEAVQEAESAQAIIHALTQELEAQNQKMAVAVTRAAASDELAAQCDHLRSEVEDRDAAVFWYREVHLSLKNY